VVAVFSVGVRPAFVVAIFSVGIRLMFVVAIFSVEIRPMFIGAIEVPRRSLISDRIPIAPIREMHDDERRSQ